MSTMTPKEVAEIVGISEGEVKSAAGLDEEQLREQADARQHQIINIDAKLHQIADELVWCVLRWPFRNPFDSEKVKSRLRPILGCWPEEFGDRFKIEAESSYQRGGWHLGNALVEKSDIVFARVFGTDMLEDPERWRTGKLRKESPCCSPGELSLIRKMLAARLRYVCQKPKICTHYNVSKDTVYRISKVEAWPVYMILADELESVA